MRARRSDSVVALMERKTFQMTKTSKVAPPENPKTNCNSVRAFSIDRIASGMGTMVAMTSALFMASLRQCEAVLANRL